MLKLIPTILLSLMVTAQAQASQCSGEPLAQNMLCAPDEGIVPDTGTDLSAQIPALLEKSSAEKKGIFFPAGEYLFSQDVVMTSRNTLQGSTQGTVFRGISPTGSAILVGDETYTNTVTDLTVSHIIFDNARVGFYGRKNRINLTYNAFVNTRTATNAGQLTASTNPYLIRGNIFMRGNGYPGVGLNTYGNAPGLIIEHNFLGSPDKMSKAAPWLLDDTKALLKTMLTLREQGKLAFDDAQDKFVAGWYSTSNLRDGTFRNNFFSGSTDSKLYNPDTGAEDITRDHAVYIKQYDKVAVTQNYFGGWPEDASGQLKFRNANGLVFAANYLDNISFNARPYDNTDPAWWIMTNTFIFNNYVKNGIINYWQNFYDTADKFITVTDYLVFSNVFDVENKNDCLVSGQSMSLSEEFYESNNRFSDGTDGVVTCGVMNPLSLDDITARLPDYASELLNLQPLKPGAD